MTKEEYCLTANLARLKTIRNTLLEIYECEHFTAEESRSASVTIENAIEKHSQEIGDVFSY